MRDLQKIIDAPQESLEIEFKNRLDGLSCNLKKSVLAKEIIALSNHGGGCIIIGFNDNDSVLTECAPEEGDIDAFNVDSICSLIQRYVVPAIQVEVHYLQQNGSEISHPIIVVPGVSRLPLWAARDSPDSGNTLRTNTIYLLSLIHI